MSLRCKLGWHDFAKVALNEMFLTIYETAWQCKRCGIGRIDNLLGTTLSDIPISAMNYMRPEWLVEYRQKELDRVSKLGRDALQKGVAPSSTEAKS